MAAGYKWRQLYSIARPLQASKKGRATIRGMFDCASTPANNEGVK